MKLFGINFGRARSERAPGAPAAIKSFGGSPGDWLAAEEGGLVFSHAYQQVAWVYRAINVLAEQVANIPFLFSAGERGRENLVTGGPLETFYHRPHPEIDRFQYWELRIIWLMLRGECFRVPIFDEGPLGQRRLDRVLIADPAHFQHIVRDHRLAGWRYTGFGSRAPLASQVFLPEEIWFEKLPNPFDFWRGLPPLCAAANAARADLAAGNFMRGIIENNADAGVIIRTEQPLDPEQQEQLFAALRERKRKAGNADRPVLLSGCSEVIRPQLSSTDLQFLENRKFSRSEICAAFGVPEEIVASTDSAKYDVMRGARLNFIENRVAPLCGRLEAAEQVTVRSLDPRAIGWFDLESLPILQEARRERLMAARTGFDMGIPFNELNRVLDLGFRALPWGNAGYISARFQRLGETAPSPGSAANDEVSRKGWPERLETLLAEGCVAGSEQVGRLKSRRGKLQRYFFEQRGRVLARMEALRRPGVQVNQSLDLLDGERESSELLRLVEPWLREDFLSAAQSAPAAAGQSGASIAPELVESFLAGQEPAIRALNEACIGCLGAGRVRPVEFSSESIRQAYNAITAAKLDSFLNILHASAAVAGRVTGLALAGKAPAGAAP